MSNEQLAMSNEKKTKSKEQGVESKDSLSFIAHFSLLIPNLFAWSID
jgi:hypothetical protein